MRNYIYRGINITPAGRNASGIRWHAFGPNGQLRAQTLEGMRRMIRAEVGDRIVNIPKIVQKLIDDAGGAYRGNVVSPIQFSSYIRAHDVTECNGREYPPGHLRAFDMKGLDAYPLARRLAESAPQVTTVVYVWRHNRTRSGRPLVYGATLATSDGRILRSVQALGVPRAFEICAHLERLAKLHGVGEAAP